MIHIQNLTKYYDGFCAVDNISLSIPSGQILGLLGPNGAGKTTSLRMLTGYFKPTSGAITVKDLKIPQDTLKIKSLIGYLPESAPLYHNMLVYDYLEYVARIKGLTDPAKREARFRELSKLCGLSGIMAKPIANLSKGLKQRVGLAHAMMTNPEILVLDEPTSGLDPNQIAEIRDIIRAIGKEKTIIFSTHILSEAEATCDRIVIINKGKVVADDTTANLTHGARKNVFLRLSMTGPDRNEAASMLAGLDPDLDIRPVDPREPGMVSFEIRTKEAGDIRETLYLAIKKTNWIITEFAKESQALEQIFHELTREEA